MHTFIEENKGLIKFIALFLGIFLVAATIAKLKEYRYIGTNASNTITVSGTGKVERSPDTAKISFSVQDEQKVLKTAQENVSKKIDALTAELKAAGIEEKYIKTDSYNSYPQYDYPNVQCFRAPCPQTSVLRGYRVTHSITVSVKDLDKVESVLGILGNAGVTDLSGPNLGFEDDTAVAREARDLAIADAKTQAKALAKSLGVRLVRIVSFNEGGNAYPVTMSARPEMAYDMKAGSAANVTLPIGDQSVQSNVTIVYEIQ